MSFSPQTPTWPFTTNLILSKRLTKTKGGLTIYSPSRSEKVGGSGRKIWGRNPKTWHNVRKPNPQPAWSCEPLPWLDLHHIHPSPCPHTLSHGSPSSSRTLLSFPLNLSIRFLPGKKKKYKQNKQITVWERLFRWLHQGPAVTLFTVPLHLTSRVSVLCQVHMIPSCSSLLGKQGAPWCTTDWPSTWRRDQSQTGASAQQGPCVIKINTPSTNTTKQN